MATRKSSRTRFSSIKLLLLDVDGVMTDSGIYFTENGDEIKKFNIQDGYGIVKLQRSGITVGIITGRVSKLVQRRAHELGIQEVYQNLDNKLEAYQNVRQKLNVSDSEVAYIGDDEPDLPVIERVAFSAAPADAVPLVKKAVDYVCKQKGGEGAIREVADLILSGRKHGK